MNLSTFNNDLLLHAASPNLETIAQWIRNNYDTSWHYHLHPSIIFLLTGLALEQIRPPLQLSDTKVETIRTQTLPGFTTTLVLPSSYTWWHIWDALERNSFNLSDKCCLRRIIGTIVITYLKDCTLLFTKVPFSFTTTFIPNGWNNWKWTELSHTTKWRNKQRYDDTEEGKPLHTRISRNWKYIIQLA